MKKCVLFQLAPSARPLTGRASENLDRATISPYIGGGGEFLSFNFYSNDEAEIKKIISDLHEFCSRCKYDSYRVDKQK